MDTPETSEDAHVIPPARSVPRPILGITICLALLITAAANWHFSRYPAYLPLRDRFTLLNYLRRHPEYRLLKESDCNCDEQLEMQRTGKFGGPAEPDYQPFYASADLNGDGHRDFAVMLLDLRSTNDARAIAIFNGPFNSLGKSPALLLPNAFGVLFTYELKGTRKSLSFGPFESDDIYSLEPKSSGYVPVYEGPTDEDLIESDEPAAGETESAGDATQPGAKPGLAADASVPPPVAPNSTPSTALEAPVAPSQNPAPTSSPNDREPSGTPTSAAAAP